MWERKCKQSEGEDKIRDLARMHSLLDKPEQTSVDLMMAKYFHSIFILNLHLTSLSADVTLVFHTILT